MELLKIRSLRKRLSSYINAKVDNDGRMRCTISVGGTETGRFSHSKTLWGTGCNLATIPRELRSMFIADTDCELAELDLNRGESWVYSHLASDPVMMAIHREGRDFHVETACAISTAFDEAPIRVEEWSDFEASKPEKAYKLRFLGKKDNHASAYRMGPMKGAEEVNKMADDTGITCTSAQFKEAQRLWIRKYSQVPNWWKEIESKLGVDRTLSTAFGRVRTFYGHWGDELFKEATAYVPQSTSVDYLNLGLLNVHHNLVEPDKKWDLRLLHQNHDSILIQYSREYRDEVLAKVIDYMTHTIEVNGYDISIPIEAQVGQSWGELSDWEKAA
jgi:DNA polymerase I-like protein with 3'-5' exonuclease and polymerase domains